MSILSFFSGARWLKSCVQTQRKRAATNMRPSAEEYQRNLIANLRDLVARLKRKSYRAKLVRRHYIPQGERDTATLGDTSCRRQAVAVGSGANLGGHL